MIKLKEILNSPQTGKPLKQVVFRGDDKQFDEFDPSYIGSKGYDTAGFWVSSSEEAAEYYGERVRRFVITMKNPMVFSAEDFVKGYPKGPPHFARLAQQKGHDGVVIQDIMDGDRYSDVYCVFDASQITPA
jgi:hypothetical protein